MRFACFDLIDRKSCWMAVKICVRRLSNRSWRIILKKYPRPHSSKSFTIIVKQESGSTEASFHCYLVAKIQLISPISSCKNPMQCVSNQKFRKWCWMFLSIRVCATLPTLTSPYGHFLCTFSFLYLHVLQAARLVSGKAEFIQS